MINMQDVVTITIIIAVIITMELYMSVYMCQKVKPIVYM